MHPRFQTIYGLKISKSLAKKLNKEFYRKDNYIMRRYIEKRIEYNNKNTNNGFYLYDIDPYINRNKENEWADPLAPIWHNYSDKQLSKLDRDINECIPDPIHVQYDTNNVKTPHDLFWYPSSDYSTEPIFGLKDEELFGGIAWDIQKVLKKHLHILPSTKPWETGVQKIDNKWVAYNGDNIIHRKDDLPGEEMLLIRNGFDSKNECIANQKRIWDQYNTIRKPYPLSPNEVWWYSYPKWHELDMFLEVCKELWPELDNDPLKYHKYLLFYFA